MLDIASLEVGYATLDISEFDIYLMLSAIFPFIQEKLQRLNIRLDFQCPPTIGKMIGDERRLRHTLLQVLDQFIKLCPQGSDMLFKVWEEGNNVRFLIQDSNSNQNLIHPQAEALNTMVATDTLDAIGSPVIKSLLAMHGGSVETRHLAGQHYSVALSVARHHEGLENFSKNVQISSSL